MKVYELSNHLGNVLTTINDRKTVVDFDGDEVADYYEATVITAQDYYPFGLTNQFRRYTLSGNSSHRFGFNGKEQDTNGEWGSLVHYDYGFRIYNPSIARFLSVDPISASYPELTPYQFAGNMPIVAIDLDGLEPADGTIEARDGVLSNPIIVPIDAIDIYRQAYINVFSNLGNPDFIPRGAENTVLHFFTHKIVPEGVPETEEQKAAKIGIYGDVTMALFSEDVSKNKAAVKTINLTSKFFYNTPIASFADILIPSKATITAFKATFGRVSVDLMGGTHSKIKGFINFDTQAISGIKDDVANFSKHFGKNSVDEIVVNNPQADFLTHIASSVKEGGTVTIRGQMGNPHFKKIFKENAKGLEGFKIKSKTEGLSKEGFTRTDGSPLRGGENSINEVILIKQ